MKKHMLWLTCLLSVAVLFGACTQSTGNDASNSGGETDTVTVTDLKDREVRFQKNPEKIVVANYIANYLMVGGAESLDKVVGMTFDGWEDTRYGEYTVFTEAFPKMLGGEEGIPSVGGYHDDVLNAEKIISLQPDVLLISISQYTENNQSVETFEKAGISVIVLDYHAMVMENHIKSTEILGKLLGREETAKEQCDTYRERIEEVNKRISALSDEEKGKRVYVELGNVGVGEYGNSYNNTMLWGAILGNIGADNLAKNLDAGYGPLDKEFVLSSDPEVVVIGGSIWSGDTGGDQMRMGFTIDEATAQARLKAFAERSEWKDLTAVKNGEVYGVDHGSLRNMADYTFTCYLAKVVYPELFEDIDPVAEMYDFYETYLPELKFTGTFMIQLDK